MTTATALDVSLIEGQRDNVLPVYTQYARQSGPQDAFIALDENGRLWADYNGEIGNAVPSDVWHGRTLRVPISPELSGAEIADFVTETLPLWERIAEGLTVEWNGNNTVGVLTDDAREALEDLQQQAEALRPAKPVWHDTDQFFGDARADLEAEIRTGRSLEEMAAEFENDAAADGYRLVPGETLGHLRSLKADMDADA